MYVYVYGYGYVYVDILQGLSLNHEMEQCRVVCKKHEVLIRIIVFTLSLSVTSTCETCMGAYLVVPHEEELESQQRHAVAHQEDQHQEVVDRDDGLEQDSHQDLHRHVLAG